MANEQDWVDVPAKKKGGNAAGGDWEDVPAPKSQTPQQRAAAPSFNSPNSKEFPINAKEQMSPEERQYNTFLTGAASGYTGAPETLHPIQDLGKSMAARGADAYHHPLSTILDSPLNPAFALQRIGGAVSGLYGPSKEILSGDPEQMAHGAGSALGQVAQLATIAKAPEMAEKPSMIGELAKENPDIAAQRALRPPAKKAISAQNNLDTARPYLKGAETLEDLQSKQAAGKQEVWKPYNDAVQKVGNNPVQGPDGPTTVAELEKQRLKTSADLQSVRKMNPSDRQTALQKDASVKELMDRDKAIKAALDPELEKAGIDPQLIRQVHGSLQGVGKFIEGRNTLTESKPYGFGRMAKNLDILHPIRSLTEIGGGIRDIAAGRPLWEGSPTDVAVKEGFRTGGAKPNLAPGAPPIRTTPFAPPNPSGLPPIGTASERPQVTYKPSEKAASLTEKPRDLGREFDEGELTHEIDRNKSILRNPRATAEDRRIAQDRLREATERRTSGVRP